MLTRETLPIRVTMIGHAGLLIETEQGTVVCDPWFNPAFFGSWFVFPRNDRLGADLMGRITRPDFLYISHIHGDHLDEDFLRQHMDKGTTVLVPDYPSDELDQILRGLGFNDLRRIPNRTDVEVVDGLHVMICTETTVADGPQGDSLIVVSDGEHRIVNQNDCRPHSFDVIAELGRIDVQFLQYSGAIWYPMVYEMADDEMARLSRLKRESQLARAIQYVKLVDARAVVPFAGPPAFLDPDLFAVNDLGNPNSIFPDQRVFLDLLDAGGYPGLFTSTGSTIVLDGDAISVEHLLSDEAAKRPYDHKAAELAQYQADWLPWLDAQKAGWVAPQPDLVGRLKAWWEPLLDHSPNLRRGVGACVLVRSGDADVLIDFPAGQVAAWAGEEVDFRFEIPRQVLETVVARRAVDWSNALFLSCRFRAWRAGSYNEYVYNFFKSLSPERMARAEAEATKAFGGRAVAELGPDDEVRFGGHLVERYCPHRHADLAVFGDCDGETLTCTLHGWQFDLATGNCRNSADRHLRVRSAGD